MSDLAALAHAYGISTSYDDWRGRPRDVPVETVRALLGALGATADNSDEVAQSLEAVRLQPWRELVPPVCVLRQGESSDLLVHVPEGSLDARIELGNGGELALAPAPRAVEERRVDDVPLLAIHLSLPADLPLGDHRLLLHTSDGRDAGSSVIVAPQSCPLPPGRLWGWMLQLYALRSRDSWGMGDLADLERLGRFSATRLGADFLVSNPLHATTPVVPQQPSPYYPSSRRFFNPLYLRIENVPELGALGPAERDEVVALATEARSLNGHHRIERDVVFHMKQRALQLLYDAPRSSARSGAFAEYRANAGQGLVDFATFCALAERHDAPFQSWPPDVRHPRAAGIAATRRELAARIDFHAWTQWLLDEQLAQVQAGVTEAGMRLGVIHDLAVGVDPGGADAWALQDDLAAQVTVGAPPDAFNQQGQDWGLPPFIPDRLAGSGYAPFRDLLRQTLRHAGGIRVDHILGLFRTYWIPEHAGAAEGAYVQYPARDLLGVLALEAHRAQAVVVGEDLGTVPAGVREALAEHQILGSRVVYFERDADGDRLPPREYPELALTSVTTHDLPTAAGWWADEDVRVQGELGLFDPGTTIAAERERKAEERAELCRLLRAEDLVGAEPSVEDLTLALHELLRRTPSLLIAATPYDAVADPCQPNMPGTLDEYPNWRLPLTAGDDPVSAPLSLEAFLAHPGVRALAAAMLRDPEGPAPSSV